MKSFAHVFTFASLLTVLATFSESTIVYSAPTDISTLSSKARSLTFKFAEREASLAKITWHLSFLYKKEEYVPFKADAVIEIIDSIPRSDSARISLSNYELESKELLKDLTIIGDDYLYFLNDSKSLPIMIVNRNGSKCLVVVAATNTVYNTLRSSTKQRAAKTIAKYSIPILRNAAEAFAKTNIKQVAIFMIHGSKDFSSESSLNVKSEAVAVVTKMSTIKQFIDATITDQELINTSDVLISDRNSIVSFMKTKVLIE
jgi:hypothetical protein